ncbi:MAG: serine/threonine-protein kinase [Phycisphaerae bacterium]|nr:serine/threonine-protein kinase [Phycisphaerae bacterium]
MANESNQPESEAAERLKAAWGTGEQPRLADFLPKPLSLSGLGASTVLVLVRIDTLERRKLRLPAGIRLCEEALGLIAPSSPLAQWLIAEEITHASAEGGAERVEGVITELPDAHRPEARRLRSKLVPNFDAETSDYAASRLSSGAGADTAQSVLPNEPAPERIGPYRLKHTLGRGGFGEVWLAVDERFDRAVALKLIRADRLDERTIKRFEVERESLRLLAHPNVAKILDAGFAPDGRPFLAMEYVRGQPLTTYCDRVHLSFTERLNLFAKVCDAVHYIHLQGLLHRDLSPDNILVVDVAEDGGRGEPEPKIIDFGVAKPLHPALRLSERTMSLEIGVAVGKWLYMSPEQAEGGVAGIDARSDIYALGVTLYQLLAGVLPLDGAAIANRAVREAIDILIHTPRPEPATRWRTLEEKTKRELAQLRGETDPESLARRLEGRVRYLPLTAMHIDRRRRFSSAAAMAADIRRFIRGEDFSEARKDPWWDRTLRGTRRHWIPVSVAAALLVAIVLGFVGTLIGLRQAQLGRAAADRAAGETTSVVEFLAEGIVDEDGKAVGDIGSVFAQAGESARSQFTDRPALQARMLTALGGVLVRVGAVEAATRVLEGARKATTLAGDGSTSLASINLLEAEALWRDDKSDEAFALARSAVDELRRSGAQRSELAAALNILGGALKHSGQRDEAEAVYRESLAIRESESPPKTREKLVLRHNLALVEVERAKAESKTDPIGAEKRLRAAIDTEQQVWKDAAAALGATDRDALAPASEVAVGYLRLATLKPEGTERALLLADAERVYREILALMRQSFGSGHWRTLNAVASFGFMLQLQARHAEAIGMLESALDEYRVYRGRAHGETVAVTKYLVTSLVATKRDVAAADQIRRTLADVRAADPVAAAELTTKWRALWPELVPSDGT